MSKRTKTSYPKILHLWQKIYLNCYSATSWWAISHSSQQNNIVSVYRQSLSNPLKVFLICSTNCNIFNNFTVLTVIFVIVWKYVIPYMFESLTWCRSKFPFPVSYKIGALERNTCSFVLLFLVNDLNYEIRA